VALDLALQAAGLIAAPIAEPTLEELERRGCQAWIDIEGIPSSLPAGSSIQRIVLPDGESPGAAWPDRDAGGALVIDPAGVREIDAPALEAEARRVAGLLPSSTRRDILIAGRAPEDPSERAILAWATLSGAAVVLAPSPEMRVTSAIWARPTLFHGTAAEVSALSAALTQGSRRRFLPRRRSLPFGRLRAVLVTGPEDLPSGEREAWAARGVAVVRDALAAP